MTIGMNDLGLRISGGVVRKKTSSGIAPVHIPDGMKENFSKEKLYDNILNASSAEEQLNLLKDILSRDSLLKDLTQFLVLLYLYADIKHPVKCFLTRYVTKNINIQATFASILQQEIKNLIDVNQVSSCKEHADIVIKIISCSENFPTGVEAVKCLKKHLMHYLCIVLECCKSELSDRNELSPTEKNDIFNLAHITLRAILSLVQKDLNDVDKDYILGKVDQVVDYLVYMFDDDDVPMDTKSICGILYLCIYVLENGTESWVHVLQESVTQTENLKAILTNESAQLCLCTAVATAVSVDKLQHTDIDGTPVVQVLSVKLLNIGERYISESPFILAVTRALVQLCKMLDRLADQSLGMELVELYLVFVWAHLDHYMDSVRHLTAQALGHIVKFCCRLERKDNTALEKLFSTILSLSKNGKAYYVGLTALTQELGADRVVERIPDVIEELVSALDVQAVQASALTALESIVSRLRGRGWVRAALRGLRGAGGGGGGGGLERLLAAHLAWDADTLAAISPYMTSCLDESAAPDGGEIKCGLLLLKAARRAGVGGGAGGGALRRHALHPDEEIRLLSISLVVESTKSTEKFTEEDFQFIRHFLKYNINVQSPHFRQQMLCLLKKFVRRVEESYVALKRTEKTIGNHDYYVKFVKELRAQCFDSLLPATNYSRRCIALQMLVWLEQLNMDGCTKEWSVGYVEKLYQHLDDSFENNKILAFEVLRKCPVELLQEFLEKPNGADDVIEEVLTQARSVKPTDCVTAGYKLKLIKERLPQYVLKGKESDIVDPVTYHMILLLLERLGSDLEVAKTSISLAALRCPMYGLLHCICHLIKDVDCGATSTSEHWTELVRALIEVCMEVNAAAGPVVSSASPEGHLPMDLGPADPGPGPWVPPGPETVSAQMVLLCAWRSVKEVSLLLGEVAGRFAVAGEGGRGGNLTRRQLRAVGAHFTALLTETKHRGAFEQAYVGFTKLLTRLWHCKISSLHSLPAAWLAELMVMIQDGEKKGVLCCTRRSAGLPFMIQALVTTELQLSDNARSFHACADALLRLAEGAGGGAGGGAEARAHALNVLRALFRHSALADHSGRHAARALAAAVRGTAAATWPERNSSTLLFSALMARVFGAARRGEGRGEARGERMTGRIFFLRYPKLYDFMLEILKEVKAEGAGEGTPRPELYPVLLLLSRLYPSSLEGTVSNLKLAAFAPLVRACARSPALRTRRLAARAAAPLVPRARYFEHLLELFTIISDEEIPRNYCHGILLQIVTLLEGAGGAAGAGPAGAGPALRRALAGGRWLARAACRPLLHEYLALLNLALWRLPWLLNEDMTLHLIEDLQRLIFARTSDFPHPGRDLALADAARLYLIILYKRKTNIVDTIVDCLTHPTYEVTLAVMDFTLTLHGDRVRDEPNAFDEHWAEIAGAETDEALLKALHGDSRYVESLSLVHQSKHVECKRKSLKLMYLIDSDGDISRSMAPRERTQVVCGLIDCAGEGGAGAVLGALLGRGDVTGGAGGAGWGGAVTRAAYACSAARRGAGARAAAAALLRRRAGEVWAAVRGAGGRDAFEVKATFWALLLRLLGDDAEAVRAGAAAAVAGLRGARRSVAAHAQEAVLALLQEAHAADDQLAMFLVLSLIDFEIEVCTVDSLNDECRVFDQNEKYNTFMEETILSRHCISLYKSQLPSVIETNNYKDHALRIMNDCLYKEAFRILCGDNVRHLEEMLCGRDVRDEVVNPKVLLINDMLTEIL